VTRRRAFIIGENGPSEGTVRPLVFAERDASQLKSKLVTTAMPLSTIRSILENCVAGTKILVLDCCHSGAAVGRPWGTKGAADEPGNRLDAETRDCASLVIAASERFSTARESAELGGGIMTSFLIEAFTAPDRSDRDRDGRLSVAETMEWLRLHTRAYNAVRDVADQIDVPIL
jgi:hypothetical protein